MRALLVVTLAIILFNLAFVSLIFLPRKNLDAFTLADVQPSLHCISAGAPGEIVLTVQGYKSPSGRLREKVPRIRATVLERSGSFSKA